MDGAARTDSRLWWAALAALAALVGVTILVINHSWAGATRSEGNRPVLVPISPCRLADTRSGGPIGPNRTLQPGGTIAVDAHGTNGQCTLPTDAVALSMNVTALDATATTYLTIWDDGPMPNASSLNPEPGQPPTPNQVTTPLSGAGGFNIFNFAGTVDVIVDVNGFFAHHDHDDRYDTSAEVDGKIAANPGPIGPPGPPGPQGDPGVPGPKGDNGGSCSVSENGYNTATLTCDDGTSVVIPLLLAIEFIDSSGDRAGNDLDGPFGVAVDGWDNIYVTGYGSDNVFRVTPGGVITEIIDATGDGTGNTLDRPIGVAVDGAGNAYIVGQGSDNAFKVTPGGVITEIIDATGDGTGNPLNLAEGVAVDGSGHVYVASASTDDVFKVAPGGATTVIIDATGDGTGNTLTAPWGLAVDGSGNVYVTGRLSDNVFKLTPAGVITEIIDAAGDRMFNGLDGPYGVAADGVGDVYVTGHGSDNAFKMPQ